MLSLIILLNVAVLAFATVPGRGGDSELKSGDIIGPHNWRKVENMVGENLLNRIKAGYTFEIKQPTGRKPPREYIEATEKYSGSVSLGRAGQLVNYLAGVPFPALEPNDPQAGLKLVWNFRHRWAGDDHKEGGGTKSGRSIARVIEKNGAERRSESIRHEIRLRGRVTLHPKPVFKGYEHIDWMELRAQNYPRDTSGTTTLTVRYVDPERQDDLYVYVPSIRRVRRAPPTLRCATLAPTEFTADDINSFQAKIPNFTYKILGKRQMLGNFATDKLPFHHQDGDYLPIEEGWEIVDTYVLEITPKDPAYCYPKKLLYIEPITYQALWVMISDTQGNPWKESFNLYTRVTLEDGQQVVSTGSPVIVNLQNRRSTVLTTTKTYNVGYQPSLFTLATLQTMLRGGALR